MASTLRLVLTVFVCAVTAGSCSAVALASSSPCFPGFSPACCAAMGVAEAMPAFKAASEGVMEASGEAVDKAFAVCDAATAPCTLWLPNGTSTSASCCAADARPFWTTGFPGKAADALHAAGAGVPGGGNLWWVNVNQTDAASSKAPTITRKVLASQYPAWYPASCDPVAIGHQESMFCSSGAPVVLECWATVSKSLV
jgi:hypothetical protein